MAATRRELNKIRQLGLSLVAFIILARADDSSGQIEKKKVSRLCGATAIVVKSVYLTCDSPGTYYYGGTSYRKSLTCKYGDSVNLSIFFTINSDEITSKAKVSVDVGVYDALVRVQELTKLCNYRTLQSDVDCPSIGEYSLDATFSLPDLMVDQALQYTPDVRLKFYAGDGTGTVIGCASTGTIADYLKTTEHSKNGQVALGAAIAIFTGVFGCLLLVSYRQKKRLERERAAKPLEEASHYGYVRSSKSGHVMRLDANGQLH